MTETIDNNKAHLIKKIRNIAQLTLGVGTMSAIVAAGIWAISQDTDLETGYELAGNSVKNFDGGISMTYHSIVTFADGTTTNLAPYNFRSEEEFKNFLAQNPEHSRVR